MASREEVERFAERLAERFEGKILERYLKPFAKSSCIYLRVGKEHLREVAEALFKELEGKLSTISAVEHASFLELVYHFTLPEGILVNVKVELSKERPEVPSLTPLMAGASFIEREVKDLFGVEFQGHPDPRRLILPDDWPEGVYPLRRSYKAGGKHA